MVFLLGKGEVSAGVRYAEARKRDWVSPGCIRDAWKRRRASRRRPSRNSNRFAATS